MSRVSFFIWLVCYMLKVKWLSRMNLFSRNSVNCNHVLLVWWRKVSFTIHFQICNAWRRLFAMVSWGTCADSPSLPSFFSLFMSCSDFASGGCRSGVLGSTLIRDIFQLHCFDTSINLFSGRTTSPYLFTELIAYHDHPSVTTAAARIYCLVELTL